MEVMLKKHLINFSPYITHPNGVSTVHSPTTQYYRNIDTTKKQRSFLLLYPIILYKLVRHMDDIDNDIILPLIGAFLNPTDKEAVVPFIIEQECDELFCGDVDK